MFPKSPRRFWKKGSSDNVCCTRHAGATRRPKDRHGACEQCRTSCPCPMHAAFCHPRRLHDHIRQAVNKRTRRNTSRPDWRATPLRPSTRPGYMDSKRTWIRRRERECVAAPATGALSLKSCSAQRCTNRPNRPSDAGADRCAQLRAHSKGRSSPCSPASSLTPQLCRDCGQEPMRLALPH